MPIIILVSILLIALIYLHITENSLIFQHGIKHCRIILLVSLILIGVESLIPIFRNLEIIKVISSINATVWGLVILAYYIFFSACYNIILLKRIDKEDPILRDKVKSILQSTVEKEKATPEYKIFIATNYLDPLLEKIRKECESLDFMGLDNKDVIEKIKTIKEQL